MKTSKLAILRHKLLNQNLKKSYREKEIKTEDYHLTFQKNFNKLKIHDFVAHGKLSPRKAIELREKIIKYAQEHKLNKIVAKSWILYEYPKYAELLGFKLVKKTASYYEEFKDEYNIKKVIGADINKRTLFVEDKEGRLQEITVFPKYQFPEFEINLKGKEKI